MGFARIKYGIPDYETIIDIKGTWNYPSIIGEILSKITADNDTIEVIWVD